MKSPLVLVMFGLFFSSIVLASPFDYLPQGFCPTQVNYSTYSLCYEPEHRQASWVKHKLTLEQVNGKQKRTNNYRRDSNIEDPVFKTDYKGTGFDRGHLLPAADRKKDRSSMSETFYMTNMSPQRPGFNRRIWAAIENEVRRLVREKQVEAHVVTGPLLNTGLSRLFSGVSIPDWYYKIIYLEDLGIMKAYLIENKQYPHSPLNDFLVSVDEVEALSGLDFFAELPDPEETHLESQVFGK